MTSFFFFSFFLLVCLGNRKYNSTLCCLSEKFASDWTRQRCVSSAPALQVWVPTETPVKHSSSVALLFLPHLPLRFWNFLSATYLLSLCSALLMSAETQSDSFLCLKIQSVSSCLCRWQIHSSQMSTGCEIFTEGAQLEVRNYCYSFFVFPFPEQYWPS